MKKFFDLTAKKENKLRVLNRTEEAEGSKDE